MAEFDHLTDKQLVDEVKRLWREQEYFRQELEREIKERGYRTSADDYIGDDAERLITKTEAECQRRGLVLLDRYEYVEQSED